MSFEDSILNFCLSCDSSLSSNNDHNPYCSQACRLADLEKSGSLDALWSSTSYTTIYQQPVSSFSSTSSLSRSFPPMSTGFYLPPPIDFAAYKREISLNEPQTRVDVAPSRSWSIGSSSSTMSASPANSPPQASALHVSPEAKAELRRYESLFDQTRQRSNRASWA